MNVRPIRTDADLTWALREIQLYFDAPPAPGTSDGDRFDVLVTLVEAYETAHFPIGEVDPVACLHYAIRDLGRSQAELSELLGSRSRASEILHRRRALTLEHIRRIAEAWHLPIAILAKPYALVQDAA